MVPAHRAPAQTPATEPAQPVLRGRVHNAAGAPIAGAKVRLSAEGKSLSAMSAEDGGFRIEPVAPGHYQLTVEANGKSSDYGQMVDIRPGIPAFSIELSDRGEISIAVIKDRTAAATGGQELSSQAVSELPLNKRDFSQLLLLAAGTMTDANGATNFTAQFAINGQRGVEATFAMDGADISDPEMGGSTFSNFNVDAVEAINSSSGWMPAEVGRGAAGFTNIITRSGASGFHGSFFEFVRNSAFDARNYFDHPTPAYPGRIPPFRRNEFGFTNGGPIYLPHIYDGRNHSFYFVQYQGFRQVLGTTQVMPVPTEAERSGIDTVSYPDGSKDILNVPIDPAIASVLARYPKPNDPTGSYGLRTYATASKVDTNANQFSIRLDHKFSDKDQFFARFNYNNLTGPTTNPDQTAIDPSFAVEYIDRQRNVAGIWTHSPNARLTFESLIGITRSTPGFPTPNFVDPAIKFGDGLYEAFNSAGGSVMQAYGNLFQGRETVSYLRGRHAWKAGFEARLNRDTTYFGTAPNGEYDFGGGTAYARAFIPSASGNHDVHPGDALPDTLSGFLSGSAFIYTVAIAPPYFSSGEHTGPAAINRENYSAYLQDTWKVSSRFTLDYGLRWDLYTPITERARRTSALRMIDGKQQFVVNPQPGYSTNWRAFEPRIQATVQAPWNVMVHAGGSIMAIPPNIWQDNFLTGSTPYVAYPRSVATAGTPIPYGYKITPDQLPQAYTTSGENMFPNGAAGRVAPNTIMDIDRYEKDLAAVTAGHVVSALNLSGIDVKFGNATLYTWTLGLERKFGNMVADAAYVGTAAEKLPRYSFPNAYPGAYPGFAPHTEFDAEGNVTGGFGVENVIVADAHSNYHALQTSLSGNLGHAGPGIQASYTWGKSIDNTSFVLGGVGGTGAVASGLSQDPYDTHPEKGPSSFDATHSFSVSAAQDLRLEHIDALSAISRKVTYGWEVLGISSISSGAPFTVFSGIQQTGYGANGVDRPDQIAKPDLSTGRKNRADYFGHGVRNDTDFFSIPIFVDGGTGPNQGRFGTLGRNTFRGPAFYNFDLAVIKDTPFGRRKSGAERMDLQFRSEFFNIFNIVTMGLPANILTGSGFGMISKTAGNSRQIQFSLKLIY
ncbi:MAG TPA: carboxypeptidase regulatory-like domain-containing protein [Terracidiphilus sp.]